MARRNRALEKRLEKEYGAKIISRVLDGRTYRLAKNGKQFNVVVVRRSAKHNSKFQKAEFRKKMQRMQKLGERGKLKKNLNPRSGTEQAKFRAAQQDKINKMPTGTQGERAAKADAQRRFDASDADHKHELQANGLDNQRNMWLLESRVNSSSGSQIRHGLEKLPNGSTFRIFVDRW